MITSYDLKFGVPFSVWLLFFLGVAALLVFVLTYRLQRSVPPRVRRLLTALRLAAVAILLFCLLQPFIRQYFSESQRNHVAILLDRSQSMTIPDEAGRGRFDFAREQAARIRKRLASDFVTHLYLVGEGATPAEPEDLDRATPEAERTDLIAALKTVASDLRARRVSAVFLLTDGGHNTGGSWDPVLEIYGQGEIPIPIYPIAFGESQITDLAIDSVRVKRTVTLNTLLNVTVGVRGQGLPPGEITVKIVRLDDEQKPQQVVQQSTVYLAPDRPRAEVVFEFLPTAQGYVTYRVEIPVQPGEIVTDNNARPFAVTVTKRRLRVIYMEGTENRLPDREIWEHQYLEQALKEDNIDVTVLLRGDEIEQARKAGIYWVRHPDKGFPRTKKELYEYDVIICSDIRLGLFSRRQQQNTVDFVARYGGGFVMIGGWTAFGPGGYDESVIDKLLPVDMLGKDEGYTEEQNFQWEVTAEGYAHPIMRLDEDREKTRAIWKEKLPDFHGYNMVQRAKPAATVLAVHPYEGNVYTDNYVLLAVQQYGRGRTMAFTTDTTYGWGTEFEAEFGETDEETGEKDARYFKRFWQNAVRWLAQYRLSAPNKLAYIELEKNLYARGARGLLRVRALTPEYGPTHDAQLSLVVTTPSGRTKQLSLAKDFTTPGLFTREVTFDEVGPYDFKLEASLDGEKLADDHVMVFVRAANLEFENFALNDKLLRTIAYATGGQVFPGADAMAACDELQQTTHLVRRHTDRDVWDRWWWLAALVSLLTVEWFLRKRAGLP